MKYPPAPCNTALLLHRGQLTDQITNDELQITFPHFNFVSVWRTQHIYTFEMESIIKENLRFHFEAWFLYVSYSSIPERNLTV
jgi:hypothetical protein